MRRKIIIIMALSWLVFFPGAVMAVDATSEIPELNPLCWTEKDCNGIRSKNFGADSGEGWLKGEDPCNKSGWGKCLPAGKSKTEISFGGKTEFANVGEFIIFMYRYLLAIASILAVIVIIVSGVQWTASGGNSEMISSSKKRIGGAVIGLFIAYGSFFILNVINPALVNLRLPQVFLIKPQELMPEFCSDIEGAKDGAIKFLLGAGSGDSDQTKKLTLENAEEKEFKWKMNDPASDMFYCGKRFFAENGGQTACVGDWCPLPKDGITKMCVTKLDEVHSCLEANVSGQISSASVDRKLGSAISLGTLVVDILTEEWSMPAILSVKLASLCKIKEVDFEKVYNVAWFEASGQAIDWATQLMAGTATEALKQSGKYFDFGKLGYGDLWGTGKLSAGTDRQVYAASLSFVDIESARKKCEKLDGLKGFVLMVQMNEAGDTGEYHFIGEGGMDLGDKIKIIETGFFDRNYMKIDDRYFIQPEELVVGKRINIDPTQIKDIDEDADENVYYQKFGISR